MNLVFSSGRCEGRANTRFVLSATLRRFALADCGMLDRRRRVRAGLYWCWAMMTLWICTLATVFLCAFLQGRWREMRSSNRTDRRVPRRRTLRGDSPCVSEAGGEPEPRRAVRLPAGKKRVRKRLLRQVG